MESWQNTLLKLFTLKTGLNAPFLSVLLESFIFVYIWLDLEFLGNDE